MENNKNIIIYHCKFNFITVKNFESIVNTLKDPNNKHIYQFNVDERYPKELFDDYFKALKGRKYKKIKKGKKKEKENNVIRKNNGLVLYILLKH